MRVEKGFKNEVAQKNVNLVETVVTHNSKTRGEKTIRWKFTKVTQV